MKTTRAILLFRTKHPVGFVLIPSRAAADEDMYLRLSAAAKTDTTALLELLEKRGEALDWRNGVSTGFEGNIRFPDEPFISGGSSNPGLFLVRRLDGKPYILSFATPEKDAVRAFTFQNLQKLPGNKLVFEGHVAQSNRFGNEYALIRLMENRNSSCSTETNERIRKEYHCNRKENE